MEEHTTEYQGQLQVLGLHLPKIILVTTMHWYTKLQNLKEIDAWRLECFFQKLEILILEDGEIIEEGMRTELVADTSSRFYELLQTGLEEVLA